MLLVIAVAQPHLPVTPLNLFGSTNVTALLKRQSPKQLRISAAGVAQHAARLRNPGSPWMCLIAVCDNVQQSRIFGHIAKVSLRRIAIAYQHSLFGRAGLAQVEQGIQVGRRNRRAHHCCPKRQRLEGRGATLQFLRRSRIHHAAGTQQRNRSSVGRARRRQCGVDLRHVLHLRHRSRRDCPTAQGSGYRTRPDNVQPLQKHVRTQALVPRHDAGECARRRGLVAQPDGESQLATSSRRCDAPAPHERWVGDLRQFKVDLARGLVDITDGGNSVGSQFVDIGLVARCVWLMYCA